MEKTVAELRREYAMGALTKREVESDPFKQFQRWLQEAITAELPEPNAMTLATVKTDGTPAARVVLLKGLDERGFVFFTNYQSNKGMEIAENPRVALVFLWKELERQVCIQGSAGKIAEDESEAYFRSRPQDSRLGALASRQSQVVESRQVLEERFRELAEKYPTGDIPKPPHWGGYRVAPVMIEFWQGRQSRLHDRLRYFLQDSGVWRVERLEP